jgi:uncharacterized protein DUF2795
MERGSDKHGHRIDEELKHDTDSLVHGSPVESRASEAREQEGPADGEPTPDALLTDDRPGPNPDTLSHDEIEARTELGRRLQPSIFPADRAAIVASAERMGASEDLVARLAQLPDGTFDHVEAVWEALGGRVEYRM